MSGPYGGAPDGGPPRRPAGARADQPPWDDSAWPQDQAGAYGDRGYGQPATGPAPSFRPQGPASGAPQGYPRPGPQGPQGPPVPGPTWPGAGYGDGYPAGGYPAGGYPAGSYPARDDSFLPGWEDQRRERDNWDMRHDRPRRKATRWAPRILLLVVFGGLLAGFLTGGLYVYHRYEAKYHPADYAGAGTKPTVTVQVISGETASGLAPLLVQLGVVASDRAFTNAAEASANPTGLEPGFFMLSHHMQASLAYAALLNPKNRIQLGVTIPEGKRVSQVIAILAKQTRIPLKNFQQVIDHPAKLGLPSYARGKVEGYLFPATYAIEPHETALAILQAMVARFNVEAAQVNLVTAAAHVGLTPTQVIIEASMAQAEGGSVSDYPKIARVIANRLKDGMHLQFDSALLYGLNAYAINVTYKQIATSGPYNDFEHAGLPPGPISNPGDAAIQAVLHPASGPWLYFLTNSGGKSTFSAVPLSGQ